MSNNIKVIKLAVTKVEDFQEKKGNQKWVFWGKFNDYPQKLIKLFNESAKHGAIVTGKASYVVGRGVIHTNPTAETDKFINKANPNDTLEVLLKKLALDYELFGGYAILVVPNILKDKPASYYHVDISKVRLSEDCKTVFISDEWETAKTGKPKKAVREYPVFDGSYQSESIILYTCYRPNIGIYPQPEYTQGLAAIETDARVSNFHLNNLRNGFFANKIINFNNGLPSAEEQDDIERAVQDKFTSDENAGKFMLAFNDGTERATTITDLSAGDFGDQFSQLRKDTEQEIFIAHKIPSPMLFGVRAEGQLGGRNELLEAFELFKNTYVEERVLHFENLINELGTLKGLPTGFELLPFVPMQMQMSENVMSQVLTKDEIREMYGFKAIDIKTNLNATNDAINSLSPLVANKVLESMTPNEIRGLVALPPKEDGGIIPETQPAQFKFNDVKEIAVFSKYGSLKEKFEKLNAVQVKHLSMADMDTFHISFNEIQKEQGVNEYEKGILKKIAQGQNPKIEAKTEEKLKGKKLIVTDRESGAYKLTELGGLLLTELQPNRELAKLRTVYEYVKRPDASGPDILPDGRTRGFCEALVKSNKYFSREDINNISAELGYDVWTFRGGWLTLPNGNHRPSCRHIWNAVLVAEK